MEWLNNILSQELIVLSLSIVGVITVFIFAARKAHLNYLDKMKKIEESFNRK